MIKIGIIGPESTGKSSLTKKLAEIYKTVWIEEFARNYLENLGRNYVFEDLELIAENQFRQINSIKNDSTSSKFCFIDTELIVMKVWSEFKYNNCCQFILDHIPKQDIDFYFLCYPDTPWEFDPLRENPTNRLQLFEIYQKELQDYGFKFEILKGGMEQRIEQVKQCLKKMEI